MRFPDSRQSHRPRRHLSPLVLVLLLFLLVSMITGVVLVVLGERVSLLGSVEGENNLDAIQLVNAGEYATAIDVLSRELAEHPMDGTALALRGFSRFYLATEQVNREEEQLLLVDSVRDLRRALIADPPALRSEIHLVLGKAYYHRGDYYHDLTVFHLTEAMAVGREELEIYEYLGLAYQTLGDVENARTYLRAAAETSNDPLYYLALGDHELQSGELLSAERAYSQASDRSDDGIVVQRALIGLGRSLRARGMYDAALAGLERVLDMNPGSAEAHFEIGEVYLAQGMNDRARFEWREALRLDPNHVESFQRLQEY